MERLLSWSAAKGAQVRKLKPLTAGSRDFVVTEDVEAGDTLIAVPQELLLHAQHAFEDVEYQAAFKQLAAELRAADPSLDDRHILCMLLVLEKARQADSSWDPYISVLPDEYDDPYWWHDEQIQLLKGTRLSRAIAAHHQGLQTLTSSLQRLEQLYSAIRPAGSPPSVLRTYRGGWALKLHAARWARSAVWSRSFTIKQLANGARNIVAMVPVLDMIDHSPHVEVVWHTGRDGTEPFQFTPLTSVKKDTVMVNNYGRKTSEELLLAYGFLLDGPNPADHVVVSLAHSRLAPNQQGSEQAAASNGHAAQAMASEPVGDGGDEDQAMQQQAAEDLQRSLALSCMGLAVDQQLSATDPLPKPLLLGAQLCLLPMPQLYLWSARLLAAARVHVSTHPCTCDTVGEGIQLAGHKRAWQQMQLGDINHVNSTGGNSSPASRAAASATAHPLSALLSADSAMHIMPVQPQPARQSSPVSNGVSGGHNAAVVSGSVPNYSHAASTSNPPVHLLHRLQSLVSMQQQLRARLSNMATDAQVSAALAHTTSSTGGRTPAGSNGTNSVGGRSTGLSNGVGSGCVPVGLPQHSYMAAAYVTVQKSLLRHSLDCMAAGISQQMQAASELLQQAVSERYFTYRSLEQAVGEQVLSDPLLQAAQQAEEVQQQQQQQGRDQGQQGTGSVSVSFIDPDLHAHQYIAWLRRHGLLPQRRHQKQQRQLSGVDREGGKQAQLEQESMDVDEHDTGGPHSISENGGVQGRAGPPCLLQEVVYRRCKPVSFSSQRPSRESSVSMMDNGPSSTAGPTPAPAVSQPTKPTNGRIRGLPQASRTFTMKNAKPGTQLPGVPAPTPALPSTTVTSNPDSTSLLSPVPPLSCKRVSLPQGLSASIGIDSDHDPVAVGVELMAEVKTGDELMCVPLSCCLVAPTKEQLVCNLMVSAQQVLQSLLTAIRPHMATPQQQQQQQQQQQSSLAAQRALAGCFPLGQAPAAGGAPHGSAGMAIAPVPLPGPHGMLTWHLMHSVACPPCARLMSDVDGVQLLSEMLEDSPAGGAYQEGYDTLKGQFMNLRKAALAMSDSYALTGKDPLQRLMSLPSSYHLFCWATHVVERCSMHCGGEDTLNPSSGTSSKSIWVLAPLVSFVPSELRQAVFYGEIRPDCRGCRMHPCPGVVANPTVVDSSAAGQRPCSGTLSIRAQCVLPSGLQLSALMLLPGMDLEELMVNWGPEALPWQHLLHASIVSKAASTRLYRCNSIGHHPHPHPHRRSDSLPLDAVAHDSCALEAHADPLGGVNGRVARVAGMAMVPAAVVGAALGNGPLASTVVENGGLIRTTSLGTGGNSMSAQLAAAGYGPTVLYELYICPGERDVYCFQKLLVLAATGLGCVHYLTEDYSTEHLVMCALKICLAGQDLLQHPLTQRCLTLHKLWQQQQQQQQQSDACNSATPPPNNGMSTSWLTNATSAPAANVTPSAALNKTHHHHHHHSQPQGLEQLQDQPTIVIPAPGQQHAPATSTAQASLSSILEQLADAQGQLFAMLSDLPEDHVVCKAARKQLRQMVHDARKNTRRRLKQLEAVHNVVANHMSSTASGTGPSASGLGSAVGAGGRNGTYGSLSVLGGSYNSLGGSTTMHDGVRLYLSDVVGVLDTWADHLGLNRQSDSMNKRHKGRHDDI